MAETERTWAALQALLADNTVEAISPRDLRDAIVSCLGGYASIYVDAGVTAQAFIGTPVKASCFASVGPMRGAVGDATADNITIGVAGDYLVQLELDGLVLAASVFDVSVFKNGAVLPGLTRRVALSDTDARAVCVVGFATLAAGDVIDVRLSCAPSTSATVRNAQLSVKRIG